MTRNRLAIRTIRDEAAIRDLATNDAESATEPGDTGRSDDSAHDSPAGTGSTLTQTAEGELTPEPRAGSVVVGIDGSPTSRAALRWATREAELLDAPLTLCHTHPVTGLAGTRRVTVGLGEDVLEHAVATASQHLDEARIAAILGYGDPARVLAQVSRGARMLAIGTHGYFAHGASLFEPLSLRIIAGAACPVVVHPMLAGQNGPFADHVVVGVDGSPASRAALGFAYSHAATHDRPLAAVHIAAEDDVWTANPLLEPRLIAEPEAEMMLAAETEAYAAMFQGVLTKKAVYTGRAVPGLLRAIAGAELLVIGDRGRGGARRSLLGSVAQHMVGNATCPVAVIRAPIDPEDA
jgi:nucleotide-binding universal stress UspA family protein